MPSDVVCNDAGRVDETALAEAVVHNPLVSLFLCPSF